MNNEVDIFREDYKFSVFLSIYEQEISKIEYHPHNDEYILTTNDGRWLSLPRDFMYTNEDFLLDKMVVRWSKKEMERYDFNAFHKRAEEFYKWGREEMERCWPGHSNP